LRELEGLKEIYNNYDTFIIDLWGVMHNGIELNAKAIEAIENLKKNSKNLSFYLTHQDQVQMLLIFF